MSARCSVCGEPRRSGTGGRCEFVNEAGVIRSVLACARCVARSVRLVTAPPATERTVQSDDSDVRAVLRGLARHLRGLGKAYAASSVDPAFAAGEEAFNRAADIADAWAKERAARSPESTETNDRTLPALVCAGSCCSLAGSLSLEAANGCPKQCSCHDD
jgi:hypothetical protein